jgi:hypothetical protein
MAENTVDCMTCLVQHANRLSTGGTHVDSTGVTHLTLRGAYVIVLACTLVRVDEGAKPVIDRTVRV